MNSVTQGRSRRFALAVACSFHGLLTACPPLAVCAPAESQPVSTTQPASPKEPVNGAPLDLLPADVMFAYAGIPDRHSRQKGSAIKSFLALADGARQLGLWPNKGRTFADVLSAFPLLGEYPHVLALLDVTSREVRPGSYRLNDMQAAVLLRCGGNVEPIEMLIRRLILSYTNDRVARIEDVSFTMGGETSVHGASLCYHRLTDDRLDDWAVCESRSAREPGSERLGPPWAGLQPCGRTGGFNELIRIAGEPRPKLWCCSIRSLSAAASPRLLSTCPTG
jgi:hypothetical protein